MVDSPSTKSQVFVVIATKNGRDVASKLGELGLKHYELKADTWFVISSGTTRQLAEKLGIRSGEVGTGVVCSIDTYSGRSSNDLWEWFKVNWPENG